MTIPDEKPIGIEPPAHIWVAHRLKAAAFHWHFSQGISAIESELYIPGCLSLLAGIEASIRFTLYQIDNKAFPFEEDLGAVLSNALLRQAAAKGLPVAVLAFPEERTFMEQIQTNRPGVRIVQIRNDLAHGNIQDFVNRELGDDYAFFTPECLRDLASDLQRTCLVWVDQLAIYREGMRKA